MAAVLPPCVILLCTGMLKLYAESMDCRCGYNLDTSVMEVLRQEGHTNTRCTWVCARVKDKFQWTMRKQARQSAK
eukprot:3231891-Amphidinium_carterae.1